MIWLLRHGDAEDDAPDDASRRLTEKGRRQARNAGAALAALKVDIDECLSSPKLRATETAEIACEPLGLRVTESEALRGGDIDLDQLTAGRGDVLLVGHEPDFSRAIELVTGARVDLKKGGLAAIDDGTLVALLRPAQLKVIGAS